MARFVEDGVVIDAHCHVGSTYHACYFTDQRYGVEELVKVMDSCGVDKARVSGGGFPHEVKAMNLKVLEAFKKYPDRVISFVRLNPWFDDVLDDLDKP